MSVLTERRVNKSKKSVVKDHGIPSGHVSSFYGFTGLNYESRKFKHLEKESLFFTKDKLLLHKQIKSRKFHHFKFSFTFAIFLNFWITCNYLIDTLLVDMLKQCCTQSFLKMRKAAKALKNKILSRGKWFVLFYNFSGNVFPLTFI